MGLARLGAGLSGLSGLFGLSGAMNKRDERPEAGEGEAEEERVVARQLRRFSHPPGLLRGLLHRLSLAGEL